MDSEPSLPFLAEQLFLGKVQLGRGGEGRVNLGKKAKMLIPLNLLKSNLISLDFPPGVPACDIVVVKRFV